MVRAYGRIGVRCRMLAPIPLASLDDAWPLMRQILRTRVRHSYRLADAGEAAPVFGILLSNEVAAGINRAQGA